MPLKMIPTLVYLVLLPILLALGNWQLNRAEEKRQFLVLQEQQAKSAVMLLSESTQDDVQSIKYKKVGITGHYDAVHQFLLDNQIVAGKAGYFVLTPFVLESGVKAVLVNRGWLPLRSSRSVLPDVKIDGVKTITITGRINTFPTVGIKLAEADIPAGDWPSVVQVADSSKLAKKLGYPLFGFQVELDKHLPDGYTREWRTNTLMSPEQHTAYATHWFALALTLTLLFILYSFKKTND